MTELDRIVAAATRAQSDDAKAALATIVHTQGSAYRRAGARMLVIDGGPTVGAISGGCLERDVCEQARAVTETGRPMLITYDTTSEADIVWGLGLGCNGMVRVLIEPLKGDAFRHLSFLVRLAKERRIGAAAMVFRAEGEPSVRVGDRCLLDATGIDGAWPKLNRVAQMIRDDAQAALETQRSTGKTYESEASKVEAFIEVVNPPPSLTIFGAGFDVSPVARLARGLGWHVTIVDTRATALASSRFPEADAIVGCSAKDVGEAVFIDEHTISVVMSHNYLDDKEALRVLLPSAAPYIGCLGPRKRTERLLRELKSEGIVLSEEQARRVYAPVGLDIGAETPEEIALSIVAEIRAVLSHREADSLKRRSAPIHDPVAPPDVRSVEERESSSGALAASAREHRC